LPFFVLDCLIFALPRLAAPEKSFADRNFRAALFWRNLCFVALVRLNDLKPAGMCRERAEIVLSV
jgi:hypothetical protein